MHGARNRPLWISEGNAVAELCAAAGRRGRVAVDTEADSFHSYHHKLCLVQLSFDGVDALLDPLALGRTGLEPLVGLLADGSVVKVMHGADYDLRVLDRDLGARVRGVRDTQLAAQLLGEATTGLAALAWRELGLTLDKTLQRMDWSVRPLPPEALAYAAADTACLGALEERLAARLAARGRGAWWEEECLAIEAVRWSPPTPDPLAFERLKGARALAGPARDRLAALYGWREALAASLDVPPFRVLRNEVLLALATVAPASAAELGDVRGVGRALARRHGRELVSLLASPPAAPDRPRLARRRPEREFERRVLELRVARDQVASELGIAPGVLAPRSALEAIVVARPRDRSGLEGCLGRRWRTGVLAAAFRPVIAGWVGEAASGHAPSV